MIIFLFQIRYYFHSYLWCSTIHVPPCLCWYYYWVLTSHPPPSQPPPSVELFHYLITTSWTGSARTVTTSSRRRKSWPCAGLTALITSSSSPAWTWPWWTRAHRMQPVSKSGKHACSNLSFLVDIIVGIDGGGYLGVDVHSWYNLSSLLKYFKNVI